MRLHPAAFLGLLLCVAPGAIALPTEKDRARLSESEPVLHRQRRLDYHPNSRKAMANAPSVSSDQIFVTIMFKSMARWPEVGEVEHWVTIPLGKYLESEHVPSVPENPISVSIVNVRSSTAMKVICQARLAAGSWGGEKRSITLEYTSDGNSQMSRASFRDKTNLLSIGCH